MLVVAVCQQDHFLGGLLLDSQLLRADFLLAVHLIAQEAFQLLFDFAGFIGKRLFTLRPILLVLGKRLVECGEAQGKEFNLIICGFSSLLVLRQILAHLFLVTRVNDFMKSGTGCTVKGKPVKNVWWRCESSLEFRMLF